MRRPWAMRADCGQRTRVGLRDDIPLADLWCLGRAVYNSFALIPVADRTLATNASRPEDVEPKARCVSFLLCASFLVSAVLSCVVGL